MSIVDTRSALLTGDGRTKLKQLIVQSGHRSLREAAATHGLNVAQLYQLASGEEFKFYKNNELNPFVMSVMTAFNKRLDELFDEDEYLSQELSEDERVQRAEAVFADEYQPWDTENYMADMVDNERAKRTLDAKIEDLTPRERVAIRRHYGLDSEPLTLFEVGLADRNTVTPERARQMIAKALRKLRHPGRSEELREFWSPEELIERNYHTRYYTVYWSNGETTVCIARNQDDVAKGLSNIEGRISAIYPGHNVKYQYDSLTGLWYDISGPTPTEGLEQKRQQEKTATLQRRLNGTRALQMRIVQTMEVVKQWERKLEALAEMAGKGETTLFVAGLPAFAADMEVFKGRISPHEVRHGKLGRLCRIDAMQEWITGNVAELNQSISEMIRSAEGLVFHGHQFYIPGTEPQSE